MRINRLDLTRYGKFTDHVIDFGKAVAGEPDFHIVYGLNEAGKSTTFSAFLDLLYGIPDRSPYNFLHPYGSMRIGAQLEFDGAQHDLARLKQRNGSLIDAQGSALNDALLTGATGGISRDAYRTMFSLDDQSLKDGGEAIVQSKGELGELLFSASSGLAGLSRSLASAAEEAASVYKKRSSSTKMAELKRTLEALKTERNTIDTFATAYAALTATHSQARTAYETASDELAEAKTRQAALTRILATLPLTLELSRLESDPANRADLPRPPAEWFALLPQLSRDESRLQALLEAADRTIDQLARDLDGLAIDDAGLGIAASLELLENGRARYRAAESDLPKRRTAFAEQDGMLARLLADLELAEHEAPDTLLLPASTTGILRDLIERRSGIDADIAAAERELKRTQDALDRLQREMPADAAPTAAIDRALIASVEAALARLKASDAPARLSVEERARVQLQRNLDGRMAQLSPWSGDLEALQVMKAADARQIETWRAQAMAIDRRIVDHRNNQRSLVTEQVKTEARIARFTEGGAIDDSEAARLRAERDSAWQAHLMRLDRDSAGTFQERMRSDDAASASRLAHADDLAELRQLTQRASENRAAIERERDLLDEAETDYAALCERITAYLPDMLRSEADTLERLGALEAWSIRRAEALTARKDLAQADMAIADIRLELKEQRTELEAALTGEGLDPAAAASLGDLARLAGDLIGDLKGQATDKANHDKAVAELARDLAERQRDRQAAQANADAWQQAWQETLAGTWLREKSASVAAVRAMLQVLEKLPGILRERQEMAQRVSAMERDQARFRDDLDTILGAVGDMPDAPDPLGSAALLIERHRAAVTARDRRAGKQAELDRLQAERDALAAELVTHTAKKSELTAYFGTDTLAAVGEFLDQARERDRICGRMAELRDQIAQGLRVASHDEAQRLLADIDVEDIERQSNALAARIEDLTEHARLLYADMSRARDKLDAVGGDDAVARIEAKRRTILLEMEDQAARYLTLRAGILAADRALHIYREKHRSSMLNRASEAFRLITGGNYSGLATQLDEGREILIGLPREGGSKLARTMSTGTQFQLYLALRLAGYDEFAAVRPAVPFVADDIMESFDNPRSEEVFRLLGAMSNVGQVIYLTHHWHLCEIAKTVVPQVKIHQLP